MAYNSPAMNPHIYGNLVDNSDVIADHWEKISGAETINTIVIFKK